jgi:hypothetical protein
MAVAMAPLVAVFAIASTPSSAPGGDVTVTHSNWLRVRSGFDDAFRMHFMFGPRVD